MRRLLVEVRHLPDNPVATTIFCDSQAALEHAVSHVENSRTKYFETLWHFIRESVEGEEIRLVYVATKNNLADLFTKALSGARHKSLTRLLLFTAQRT